MEIKVTPTVSPQEVYLVIRNADLQKRENHPVISFGIEDLPPEGLNHYKPLYLRVKILDCIMPCIMVDDGYALNICPSKILPQLGLSEEALSRSHTVIRAYDDSRRRVIGTFKAEVEVGEIKSIVEFTVIHIPVTFSLLLGRPWFHSLEGVPSTLHQKVKVPFEGRIVTLEADRPSVVASLSAVE